MKLEFSLANTTRAATLSADSEIFTNCDRVYVTRILSCGEKLSNYRIINRGDEQTLPAGQYEFTVSQSPCSNKYCWVCIESKCRNLYHADHFGSDDSETITDNGDGTYSWAPTFEEFTDIIIRIPACCKLTVEHSGTTDGALRLSAGPEGSRVHAFSFECPISDLMLTGSEQCLLKSYIQVKRG